jgi:mono/diheme cytochrome c family protein
MGMRNRLALVLVPVGLLALSVATPVSRSADPQAAPTPSLNTAGGAGQSYQKDVLPFLKRHCFACHGDGKAKADLSFDKYTDDASLVPDRKLWDNVLHMLKAGEMPPKERPKPPPAEVEAAIVAIQGVFDRADAAAKPNAGRVTIRRLNRTEYNNTVRDLVGVDFKPAEDFPADDVGYGFDNIGDVLSVSPLLLEKYLAAAEAILDEAIVIADPPKLTKQTFDTIRTSSTSSGGEIGRMVSFEAGEYRIRCKVGGDQLGDEPVRVMLRVMGEDAKAFEVRATAAEPEVIEAKVRVKAGTGRVGIVFLNPTPLPNPPPTDGGGQGGGRQRALHLKGVEVEGPFDPPPLAFPEAHTRLMAHRPDLPPREAAREIVSRFATRAFRRPVKPEEVERCLALYDAAEKKGQRFELKVRAALFRVLVSPHFLFRVERDPSGLPPGTTYPIGEYELASRLSYFLWNTMPDDELFALAAKGQLRQNLDAQVRRMLRDPKSRSFLHGFAEQWLTLRKLELASPDPALFPNFTPALREAMVSESLLFFEALVRDDRSIMDLLDADFTFVNEPLARHYGIVGVTGPDFVRVALPAGRRGVLTHAGILTLSSNATRTSPVKRGKFVLEQILNTPPPPPPPELEIPELEDQKELKGTLRQIMEQHREKAVCASCHQRMDPIGFAFENFDAIGAWRDNDGSVKIDASGALPDGRKFDGPAGLRTILRADRAAFLRCLAEKMLTYALGRGLEAYDRRVVNAIVEATGRQNDRFSALLVEIVKSDPFQKRTTPEK